jgi:dTDP-4-dehydrorhamnose reductase|tara:strand:+ start:2389 stop:3279 length:891 start_codon:yes stop_codon:yes gene_type:complete
MKKLYFAGSAGMLGEAFYRFSSKDFTIKCTDLNFKDEWINYLDFRNFDNYLDDVSKFEPDVLFHLGAHTDLEYCERNIDDTYITNTLSVENAVRISNELSIPLVFISTAGIFDGKKIFYDDWDLPNPLGHYAKSKYAAEKFIQYNCNKYLICRAGWMMGGGPEKDKKFVNKIYKQIVKGNKELFVVKDKLGTPTYTHDFVKNLFKILESGHLGLYNLVCEGNTSRLEVAKEILIILNLESKISIKAVNSDYFSTKFFAPRPKSENLINYKLNLRSLNIMRDWRVCLREYLNNEFKI